RWPGRNGEDTTTGRARTAAGNPSGWRRWANGAALAHRGDFVGPEAGVHGAAGHLHEHQDIGFDVVADAACSDGADVAGGDRKNAVAVHEAADVVAGVVGRGCHGGETLC